MFIDRKDAGEKLARSLEKYKDQHVIVLAIPRGGVEVGFEVATYLNAEFSNIVARKLPFPDNPEAGFGAVAEDGSIFIFRDASQWMPEYVIEEIVERQKEVVKERIEVLRKNKPLPDIKDRTVILVDDGIAMGSTMRASVRMCRNAQAGKIVVAVPVTGQHVKEEISELADEIIVLETPPNFMAVAQVYKNWHDVSDQEVINIMEKYNPNS